MAGGRDGPRVSATAVFIQHTRHLSTRGAHVSDTLKDCSFCGRQRPRRSTRCPHCGRPSDFPNVEDAAAPSELAALRRRYDDAVRDAEARGCKDELSDFEAAVAGGSKAIFACPLTKLMPLVTGLHDLYAPYYKLAELRLPQGPPPSGTPNWEILRPVVETTMFGDEFKTEIHHAALTLDGRGLSSYGECFVSLRESMIAHRASVFEENSLLFMKRHNIKLFEVDRLPKGYRATWADRGLLAVAKLAGRINSRTRSGQFPGLLMRAATKRTNDDFVEVHLFGPLTAFTFEKVTYMLNKAAAGRKSGKRSRPRRGDTNLMILADTLAKAGAEFESLK